MRVFSVGLEVGYRPAQQLGLEEERRAEHEQLQECGRDKADKGRGCRGLVVFSSAHTLAGLYFGSLVAIGMRYSGCVE